MAIANLSSIILKIRKLTGSGTTFQFNDSQIIDYINSFYLYDLPAQFRSLKLKDRYTFNTQKGIDTYPFDSEHYTTVEMPCYCSKREIRLFNDPWSFYGVNFNWQNIENFIQGDGSANAGGPGYSGTTTASPILRSVWNNPRVKSPLTPTSPYYPIPPSPDFTNSQIPGRTQNILITSNISLGITLNVVDDGAGNLIGDCTAGKIDYNTGAISGLKFTQAIPAGENINIQYNPMTLSIPLSIMFYQNQFVLRPVPDKGYTIELVAYRQPSQVLLGSLNPDVPNTLGTPELLEWWELVAMGASKKIYEERLDSDGVGLIDKMLQEHYGLIESRTYAQLGKQSINTIFRDQLQYNYGAGSIGFGNSGM